TRDDVNCAVLSGAELRDILSHSYAARDKQAAIEIKNLRRICVIANALFDLEPPIGCQVAGDLEIEIAQAEPVWQKRRKAIWPVGHDFELGARTQATQRCFAGKRDREGKFNRLASGRLNGELTGVEAPARRKPERDAAAHGLKKRVGRQQLFIVRADFA